jgi:hypothetical protein
LQRKVWNLPILAVSVAISLKCATINENGSVVHRKVIATSGDATGRAKKRQVGLGHGQQGMASARLTPPGMQDLFGADQT